MGGRHGNIYANTMFTPRQYEPVKELSKDLRITFSGAVAFALEYGLGPVVCANLFFKTRVEASPGSRLTCEEVRDAFLEWCSSHNLRKQISACDFDVVGLEICRLRDIAVRVRGNQLFCVGVRLRVAQDHGTRAA